MLELIKIVLSDVESYIKKKKQKQKLQKCLLSLAPSTVFLLWAEQKDIFLLANYEDGICSNYIVPFETSGNMW